MGQEAVAVEVVQALENKGFVAQQFRKGARRMPRMQGAVQEGDYRVTRGEAQGYNRAGIDPS